MLGIKCTPVSIEINIKVLICRREFGVFSRLCWKMTTDSKLNTREFRRHDTNMELSMQLLVQTS